MENKKLTAVEIYIEESTKLIHLYKQKRITWTEYEINLKELQDSIKELEKEQIIDAVNKTSQHDCAIANSVLRRLKKPEIFQFDEKGGEQYYNETYGNK